VLNQWRAAIPQHVAPPIVQGEHALRLAESLSDRYASQALGAHAALLERAQSLKQTEPVLSVQQPQHQQGQPPEND
jgi:hypothetical protein